MAEEKQKFTRTARPVYVIMTVKDDDGNVLDIAKENVEILSVHKNSDELLNVLDNGSLEKGTFYKRIALA
tara:strand:- start:375 stop:584 length:210 start_codon:yes stop_codon:yes gene_type:complete